jgi:hypothetical protein
MVKLAMPDVTAVEGTPKDDARTPVIAFYVAHDMPIPTEIKPRPRQEETLFRCVNQDETMECGQPLCSNFSKWKESCAFGFYPDDADKFKPEGDSVMVWGQKTSTTVRFDCWGSTTPEAHRLSVRLNDFLHTYSGVFKQQGVADMHWMETLQDLTVDKWRNDLFARVVKWRMFFEHLWIQDQGLISEIAVNLSTGLRSFYEPNVAFLDCSVTIV